MKNKGKKNENECAILRSRSQKTRNKANLKEIKKKNCGRFYRSFVAVGYF